MSKLIIPCALLTIGFVLAGSGHAEARSWSLCADENMWCEWHGSKNVRYGAKGRYVVRRIGGGGFMCGNKRFGGDPAPGAKKYCWVEQ